jgi:hypothetical protein
MDAVIVDDDVGGLEASKAAHRDQPGISWAGADDEHAGALRHGSL